MITWIVLIEDRHCDIEAYPFSSKEQAVAAARDAAPDEAGEEPLTGGMRRDGWVLYLPYGPEGDCVRVIERVMDGAVP